MPFFSNSIQQPMFRQSTAFLDPSSKCSSLYLPKTLMTRTRISWPYRWGSKPFPSSFIFLENSPLPEPNPAIHGRRLRVHSRYHLILELWPFIWISKNFPQQDASVLVHDWFQPLYFEGLSAEFKALRAVLLINSQTWERSIKTDIYIYIYIITP